MANADSGCYNWSDLFNYAVRWVVVGAGVCGERGGRCSL